MWALKRIVRDSNAVVLVATIQENVVKRVDEFTQLDEDIREQVAIMYIEPFDGGNMVLGTAYHILDQNSNTDSHSQHLEDT